MQRPTATPTQARTAGCLALCLGLCALPAAAGAASRLDLTVSDQPVYGYLLGSYSFVDSAWNADDYGLGAQIGIGVPILDWLSVEGSYFYNSIGASGGSSDLKQGAWGVDFVGQFGDRERLTPYLLFGGGVVRNDVTPNSLDDTSPFLNLGAGLVGRLQTRWLRYRAETRLMQNDYLDERTDFRLSLGLEVVLGEFPPQPTPPPPPPPPPVERVVEVPVPVPPPDQDGDGVADSFDRCPDTLPGVEVDGFGCAVKAQTVELRDVTFEFNSAALTPNGESVLEPAVKFLLSQPQLKAQIAGHTDSVGSDTYNLKLSRQRAESVRAYLVSRGVSAGQLTAVGYGEAQPVAGNDTDEGRARNRRVELGIEGVNTP